MNNRHSTNSTSHRGLLVAFCFMSLLLVAANAWSQEKGTIKIAVLGGSTMGKPEAFGEGLVKLEKTFTVKTKLGDSPTFYQMNYKGVPFYYVRFHGYSTTDNQDRLTGANFLKVFAALQQLGVTDLIGGATGGGIPSYYDYCDLMIPDDLINFNKERPSSVVVAMGLESSGTYRMKPAFSPVISKILYEEALKSYKPGRVHFGGTVCQTEPNRFETVAEVMMYKSVGCHLVTHNMVSEAMYARQLGMNYAALDSVSNPAEGTRDFTEEEYRARAAEIPKGSVPVILESVVRVAELQKKGGIKFLRNPEK